MKSWTSIAYFAIVLGALASAAVQPDATSLEHGAAHLGYALWLDDAAETPAAAGHADRASGRP